MSTVPIWGISLLLWAHQEQWNISKISTVWSLVGCITYQKSKMDKLEPEKPERTGKSKKEFGFESYKIEEKNL